MTEDSLREIEDILLKEIHGGSCSVPKWEKIQKAAAAILRHLHSSPSSSGWIKTNDRSPESREQVLAFDRIWKRIVEQSWEEYTTHDKEWFHARFSHWVPLLPPPTTSGDKGIELVNR